MKVHTVVMAGGFGTRLRPLTVNVPKPMVPMAIRPMMAHIIERLARLGYTDMTVMLYFQPEVITGYFGDGKNFGASISYLTPAADLGTAGCVRFAARHIKKTILVVSGDVLTDMDIEAAMDYHRQNKAVATMVLTRVPNPLQYGVVITDADRPSGASAQQSRDSGATVPDLRDGGERDAASSAAGSETPDDAKSRAHASETQRGSGRIVKFLEKPSWGEVFSDTINTGTYILEPEVFDEIPDGKSFDFSKDLFPALLKKGAPLFGYVARGYWKDVGDLSEYRAAHMDILAGKVQVNLPGTPQEIPPAHKKILVGEGTVVESPLDTDGQVVIGKNCRIAAGCRIEQSVIGNDCVIGPDAEIIRSVVWDGAQMGAQCKVTEGVVGCRVKVGDRAALKSGVVVSDDCVIGEDAMLRPNVKMWPHKSVEDGAIVNTSLIWGEKFIKSIFGGHGITGLGNIEITPEFAAKVGAAYGAFLGKGSYVITSRDAHPVSRMIKRSMISGFLSSGVRVGDLRTAPIPVMRYEMGKEGEAGGVHVRVSPYDPRLLDIKFFDSTGADISTSQEKGIDQLFHREDFKRATPDEVGEILAPPRAQEYYKAGFLKAIDADVIRSAKFKVVIDYAYSSASIVFPTVLGRLGCEVVALNSYLNPTKVTKTVDEFSNSLDQLSHIVTTLNADAGFLIDTGAEKVFLVDEKGRSIPDAEALVLVAALAVKTYKNGNIAVPINASSVVERVAADAEGFTVRRTRTVPRAIMAAARGAKSSRTQPPSGETASTQPPTVFVGDGLGGFIFPEFQPAYDAMYAIAKIMEMIGKSGMRLGTLAAGLPNFEITHKKIACPWNQKGRVMRHAIEAHRAGKTELLDGVKVIGKDYWVLLLPDPDEAYFHVWAEAESPARRKKLMEEYCEKVKEWQQ